MQLSYGLAIPEIESLLFFFLIYKSAKLKGQGTHIKFQGNSKLLEFNIISGFNT